MFLCLAGVVLEAYVHPVWMRWLLGRCLLRKYFTRYGRHKIPSVRYVVVSDEILGNVEINLENKGLLF